MELLLKHNEKKTFFGRQRLSLFAKLEAPREDISILHKAGLLDHKVWYDPIFDANQRTGATIIAFILGLPLSFFLTLPMLIYLSEQTNRSYYPPVLFIVCPLTIVFLREFIYENTRDTISVWDLIKGRIAPGDEKFLRELEECIKVETQKLEIAIQKWKASGTWGGTWGSSTKRIKL
jgi:hypothetical protein